MENPISVDRNRPSGDRNPIVGSSRDSYDDFQHNPLCVNPPTHSKSGSRPMQTDFFLELSLFNAHFGSEHEGSRWAQFLPEYLRPGNLENYFKQTKKAQLFGNNFWWASQESYGQDCNSRLATVYQRKRKTLLVPDGQKDLQSPTPCSQRIDHIRYSRDQLLQLREAKTASEAIIKIKQGIEVEFLGVKQMIEHGATVFDNSDTKRESGLTLKKKKEEKKMENITVNAKQELKTGEKAEQEEGVSKKRKRGMSDEKKAKKKMKERKKRAENNRKLGVKRLRIQPIVKQKPVSHCRHYMHGKCYEGETCKFSHDVVPLTKCKPCSYFARQSCMKGDDCPFDHQLSKYPCNNYVTTGSCSRGQNCLFSHEITPKQDSVSAIGIIEPETKSSNPSPNFGSIQQIKNLVTLENAIAGIGTANKPAQETKSLNFPFGTSAMYKQTNLTQKSHFTFEASAPTSTTKSSPQPYTLESIKDDTLTPKVNRPVKAPKGLSFLNTGSLLKNDSARDELTSQKTSNSVESGALSNKGMINNVSNFGGKQRSSFPTFGNISLVASAGDKIDAGDTNQKPNVFPFKFPASTSSSSSFLARLENAQVKTASNSGQRSLLSTLGFASKYDSGGTRNPLISTPAFGSEVNNSGTDHNSGTQQTESPINVNPNVVPLKFPASTSSCSPILTRLENVQVKNASGQRSLLSMLGFASKYDSGGTRNPLIDTLTFGSEVNKSRGTDHNSGTQQTESPINVNPNVGPLKFPASTNSSSPILTRLENEQVKNASGQRSLLSTLGFASKHDSGGTRSRPLISTPDHNSGTQQTESPIIVNPSVGSRSTSETGHNKPANPMDMWEMLYGGGSQTKR